MDGSTVIFLSSSVFQPAWAASFCSASSAVAGVPTAVAASLRSTLLFQWRRGITAKDHDIATTPWVPATQAIISWAKTKALTTAQLQCITNGTLINNNNTNNTNRERTCRSYRRHSTDKLVCGMPSLRIDPFCIAYHERSNDHLTPPNGKKKEWLRTTGRIGFQALFGPFQLSAWHRKLHFCTAFFFGSWLTSLLFIIFRHLQGPLYRFFGQR